MRLHQIGKATYHGFFGGASGSTAPGGSRANASLTTLTALQAPDLTRLPVLTTLDCTRISGSRVGGWVGVKGKGPRCGGSYWGTCLLHIASKAYAAIAALSRQSQMFTRSRMDLKLGKAQLPYLHDGCS
eukprot:350149-Chlamydomonas_euryale.AAC.7